MISLYWLAGGAVALILFLLFVFFMLGVAEDLQRDDEEKEYDRLM